MAIYRKIHVSFWSDSLVSELNDKSKLFYLYLITNERTTQLGVYEITKKQMAYDLGYSVETISKLIYELEKANRIRYNDKTCEIALRNWNRYNYNPSIKVKSLVDKEIIKIKDKSLIEYLYSIDTVSILNPQEEETEEEEEAHTKINIEFSVFWDLYDKKEDSKACKKKWENLSNDVREKIILHVPKYVASTPDVKFRKNPKTYLNNECWNDEVQETKSQPDVKILTRKDFYDEPAYQRYCSKNNITPEP